MKREGRSRDNGKKTRKDRLRNQGERRREERDRDIQREIVRMKVKINK